MDGAWPEFVKETDDSARRSVAPAELTGWETVVFEVAEDQEPGSDFSTAALAP